MPTITTRQPARNTSSSRPWLWKILPRTQKTAPEDALRAYLGMAVAAVDQSSWDAMPSPTCECMKLARATIHDRCGGPDDGVSSSIGAHRAHAAVI
eukprot:scaffold8_cov127-Isochrysis_galbana.AAC.3